MHVSLDLAVGVVYIDVDTTHPPPFVLASMRYHSQVVCAVVGVGRGDAPTWYHSSILDCIAPLTHPSSIYTRTDPPQCGTINAPLTHKVNNFAMTSPVSMFDLARAHDWVALSATFSSIPKMGKGIRAEAKKIDANGNLLIHWVALFRPEPAQSVDWAAYRNVVTTLKTQYPEGFSTRNVDGDIPLHLALTQINKADSRHIDIVTAILNADTNASMIVNERGDLPIHHILKTLRPLCKLHIDICTKLLAANPLCALRMDASRCLPLHLSLMLEYTSTNEHIHLVTLVLGAHPSGALTKGPNGLLPLHMAVMCRFPLQKDIVEPLLCVRQPPLHSAALVPDDDGNLPLHWAVKSQACRTTLSFLVRHAPETRTMCNKDGRTPGNYGEGMSEWFDTLASTP